MAPFDPATAYRRFLEECCNGDYGLAGTLVSDDCVLHVAGVPDSRYRGPAGLTAILEGARAPFSSLTFRIAVGPVIENEWVAARWSADGIYAGGFPGAKAPAGTRVAFGGHDFLRHRDGRFVEYWGGADDGHVMQQLGMFS
jgi:predicted ester cyclase